MHLLIAFNVITERTYSWHAGDEGFQHFVSVYLCNSIYVCKTLSNIP